MSEAEKTTAEVATQGQVPDHSREFHLHWSHQREDLEDTVEKSIDLEARAVGPEETLQDYLKEGVKNDLLVLRALSSLQLHGYWETILPEGYQIQIQAGKLSLFKQAEDGAREYYKTSQTGKLIQDLPLLEAIPHQEVLYFKSGGYKEALPLKKVSKNKAEARQMVEIALKEGRFSKLTGMVNGLKISDKVRLGTRHKVAAREMLFLLNNASSVFDGETLTWIQGSGNLDDLKALAEGKWGAMNRPNTEAFQRARSAEGVIQLTLAWRRLRSVLPDDLVNEIRKNSLEPNKISSLQMTLAQTEATSGKALAEDRRVVVESVILPKAPSASNIEEQETQKPSPPVLEAQTEPKTEDKGDESNKEVAETLDQPKDVKADQAPEDSTETPQEPTEASKDPEEIAQKIWEEDDLVTLNAVREPYPEIDMVVSEVDAFNKQLKLSYVSDLKERGAPITVEKRVDVKLATEMGNYATYLIDGKDFADPGDMFEYVAKAVQAKMEAPALEQFETLIKDYILRALPAENIPQGLDRLKENRQERQAMRSEGKGIGEIREKFKEKRQTLNQRQEEFIEGNFDSVINEIRQHYSSKSLKLNTLVGKQRYTDTTFFSGGGLGLSPLLISVERPNDETGLVFSGAKIKKPIFYSLESNTKYEVETSN